MSAVTTLDLCMRFKNTLALDKVNLNIPENCIAGLVGRNGAGKTTLLKAAAGLLRPSSGQVKVFDETPFDRVNTLSCIFFMDDDRYAESLRITDIVELSRLYYQNFNSKMAGKLLDFFQISGKSKFSKLSKGTKTLFSIVMAISSRAPLTLLDEPTSGLDAPHRKEFMSLILKDYTDFPRTIILSSHLISELEGLMEQVILIDNGRLVFSKPLEEVQNFGLYLSGSGKVLNDLVKDKKVLTREVMGEHATVGVENTFSPQELQHLCSLGIHIAPMKVQDVCISLTQIENGGVLDAIK